MLHASFVWLIKKGRYKYNTLIVNEIINIGIKIEFLLASGHKKKLQSVIRCDGGYI